MAKISVSTNSSPELSIEIDLSKTEWSSLLPCNISPIHVEESLCTCSTFKDGVFPGASSYGTGRQISTIKNFENYIEFCKLVSDEVVPIMGELFVTTKFYERRQEGWSSDFPRKKTGEIIGYCINGDVYHPADKEHVYQIFYGIIYKGLMSKNIAFIQLQDYLRNGFRLEINTENEEFLHYFTECLMKSI